MSLRTDERQWLIYGDEQVGALVRGLEATALYLAGGVLARHGTIGVRAIGNFMLRVSDARFREMLKNGGMQETVAQHFTKIMGWLGGGAWTPEIDEALDELYAVTVYSDGKAMSAGISGPGTVREAVRGD